MLDFELEDRVYAYLSLKWWSGTALVSALISSDLRVCYPLNTHTVPDRGVDPDWSDAGVSVLLPL